MVVIWRSCQFSVCCDISHSLGSHPAWWQKASCRASLRLSGLVWNGVTRRCLSPIVSGKAGSRHHPSKEALPSGVSCQRRWRHRRSGADVSVRYLQFWTVRWCPCSSLHISGRRSICGYPLIRTWRALPRIKLEKRDYGLSTATTDSDYRAIRKRQADTCKNIT